MSGSKYDFRQLRYTLPYIFQFFDSMAYQQIAELLRDIPIADQTASQSRSERVGADQGYILKESTTRS